MDGTHEDGVLSRNIADGLCSPFSQSSVLNPRCYNVPMPRYRVLYLKDESLVERFRSQPPRPGPASLKPKDYQPVAEIEAPNEYTVWKMLQGEGAAARNLRPMGVGDALEAEPERLRVCRFMGFDDAVWFTFEPKPKPGEDQPEAPGAGEASATPAAAPSEIASETAVPDSRQDPPR